MQPPSQVVPPELIERIIDAHRETGISFFELATTTAAHPAELSRTIHELRDQRLIEARDGKLFPAQRRRRKSPARPGLWSRLRAVFAP